MESHQESSDIFSLSDEVLSDRLHFIKEIGFGNWGSVWLCQPKPNPNSSSADKTQEVKVAVKLVHRSKTPTTAARVRSLWNEMKIVRSFKHDPHPSIIPFHSFIITPSYALITMAFLPTLIPVEVEESKAKVWFKSLLSGVQFLHERGVVHNDIKPANILLSYENVPVLVDFGFAEKYELSSSTAFHSNLAYGTPEYLAPERARGLPHDTRKSDVWSLGITFFEVLTGRTPFEHSEGEQFSSKEDLEKYWARTMRGKWVGSWRMSRGAEKMLRRMIAPNADLRCTASEAMNDPYWLAASSHKRSASAVHPSLPSLVDTSNILDGLSPWTRSSKNKENAPSPAAKLAKDKENKPTVVPGHSRSKSQPRVALARADPQAKKRVAANLSPIKEPAVPQRPPAAGKENVIALNSSRSARKPLGTRDALTPRKGNIDSPGEKSKSKVVNSDRKSRALIDLTGASRNVDNSTTSSKKTSIALDRMKEWEREKERLREMAQLEEIEKERDEQLRKEEVRVKKSQDERIRLREQASQSTRLSPTSTRIPSEFIPTTPTVSSHTESNAHAHLPPTPSESGFGSFKHGLKMSIDKTVQLYKSSTLAHLADRTTPALVLSNDTDEVESRQSFSERESWEDEALVRDAKSSLPVCRHAIRNERAAAENEVDRMTIWMRNVEKVVEDARQNFERSMNDAPLPPLPVVPLARSSSINRTNRSSRLPRKILAASEIFSSDGDVTTSSAYNTTRESVMSPNETIPAAETNRLSTIPASVIEQPMQTPPRARRATVTTRSPEPAKKAGELHFDIDTGSPSKRREKSRSQGNLLRPITPVSKLELELQKQASPSPSYRLSAVLDRNLFIAPLTPARAELDVLSTRLSRERSVNFDDLNSSPLHVEPYPARVHTQTPPSPLDSPNQRRIEGVYDRFLMATSGVKRAGKGYCSDNVGPIANKPVDNHRRSIKNFHSSGRRGMPPPVSSEDQLRAISVDELGVVSTPSYKDESNHTVAFVRRAFKAMTGKSVSRRQISRNVMV